MDKYVLKYIKMVLSEITIKRSIYLTTNACSGNNDKHCSPALAGLTNN